VHVLILTASYGSGHNEAARSLAAGFAARGVDVTVVDHFRDLVHPVFERVSRAVYMALLRRAPIVWGVGYALGDWMPSDSPRGWTRWRPTPSSPFTRRRPPRSPRWPPKAAACPRTRRW